MPGSVRAELGGGFADPLGDQAGWQKQYPDVRVQAPPVGHSARRRSCAVHPGGLRSGGSSPETPGGPAGTVPGTLPAIR